MLSIRCFCSFLIIGLTVHGTSADVVCRDEDGNPVDWYYLYKLPREHSLKPDDNLSEMSGLRYLYITSSTINQGWKLSDRTINDTASLSGQTISHVANQIDAIFLAYNDETPDGQVNFEEGHTKGVIAADSKTGFWLVHSVPKFPNVSNYEYPTSGLTYGQSFLCISLNADMMDLVGQQQLYNEPNIYYSRIPSEFHEKYPNLVRAAAKKWNREAPYWNHLEISTRGGTKFSSFAKGRLFEKELYEDWVAPVLDTNLLVESWRHGAGILPSNCSRRQHVLNVASVTKTDLNLSFHSTKDHSKWCVADSNDTDWICVGDINRAAHQLRRGGGTVCQRNEQIAGAYRNLVGSVEPCPAVI